MKQKGISMIQVIIVIGLFALGLISVSNLWSDMERRDRVNGLAYVLAKEQYEFAKALEAYVQDNIGILLPTKITYNKLRDEGYLSEFSYDGKTINDGVDELGTKLSGVISSPYGFTQSFSVVQEGKIQNNQAKYYGLLTDNGQLNKDRLETVYREASQHIANMSKKYTGTIVISENGDDIIRSSYSQSNESIYEYFQRSEFNNKENEIMFSTFINMEKEPGYWVLRYDLFYPSSKYGGPNGQYQKLKSLGYSVECPTPGNSAPRNIFTPSQLITLNPDSEGGLEMVGNIKTVGELVGFQYICFPATKIMVPDNEYSINTSGSHQTHPAKTLSCTNAGRKSQGYTNKRVYATTTANTFKIGNIYYSLVMKGVSMETDCDAANSGNVYMNGNLFRGQLPNRVDLLENNKYADRVNNINKKTIILQ